MYIKRERQKRVASTSLDRITITLARQLRVDCEQLTRGWWEKRVENTKANRRGLYMLFEALVGQENETQREKKRFGVDLKLASCDLVDRMVDSRVKKGLIAQVTSIYIYIDYVIVQ